jgi:hypothetical protein
MPASNFVFPVRYVSEGISVQSTSRELSALGIAVRSLAPPHVGARVSLALYLPDATAPETVIARVARSKATAAGEAGFWADFLAVDPRARLRISTMLADHGRGRSQGGQNRAFPRIAAPFPLQVRKSESIVGEVALNLSRSGIFVLTGAPPPVDTPVEVDLRLPEGAVTTKGIVVHKQESGVGIQFVDAGDEFREGVDRYTQA